MNYGRRFMTLYRRQGSRSSLWKRNAKKQKGGLSRSYKQLRKEEKQKAKEKKRYTHVNAEFQRIARKDKKAFLNDQCKEIQENNRMDTLEMSSRKLEIPREHFMQRWPR